MVKSKTIQNDETLEHQPGGPSGAVPDTEAGSDDTKPADTRRANKQNDTSDSVSQAPAVLPSANTTHQDWESERRKMADVSRTSLNAYLQSSIHQRVDLLRDTLAVAVTILIGALTLYFAAPGSIRTIPLFYMSLVALIVGVIANLIARSTIAKHLETVSYQIESNYEAVYAASKAVLASPTTTNIDSAWRIERERPPFPVLAARGRYGHLICIWCIIVALVGIALSFMFKIS